MNRRLGWRSFALALSLVTIAFLTLWPSNEKKLPVLLTCLLCGERGSADFLRNILLFVPFGMALGWGPMPLRKIVVAGALLTASVEIAQLFIPGRDSSLSDVVSNTLGTFLGAITARRAALIAHGEHVRRPGLVTAALALLPVAITAIVGVLLQPTFPRSTYFGEWTPVYEGVPHYTGQIQDARLGALPLPSEQLANPGEVRALLAQETPLRVRLRAGPAPRGLAPLFGIVDEEQREIALFGISYDDLVYRYYMRATAWRFEQPSLRLSRALQAVRPGDTVVVSHWTTATGHCLQVRNRQACGLGWTAGSGWTLLLYPGWFPARVLRSIGLCWIGALFLPLGLWVRRRLIVWSVGTGSATLGVMPWLTHLKPTTGGEWVAAVAGVCGGVIVRQILERRRGPSRPPAGAFQPTG